MMRRPRLGRLNRPLSPAMGMHRVNAWTPASPLRNRPPVLTMAAGHLRFEQDNGHQWAKEVAVPKLAEHADFKEGASE